MWPTSSRVGVLVFGRGVGFLGENSTEIDRKRLSTGYETEGD